MANPNPMTHRIVVTQGVSEEGEAFLVILVFLLAVLHLLVDDGLKHTAVHSVETLGTVKKIKKREGDNTHQLGDLLQYIEHSCNNFTQ